MRPLAVQRPRPTPRASRRWPVTSLNGHVRHKGSWHPGATTACPFHRVTIQNRSYLARTCYLPINYMVRRKHKVSNYTKFKFTPSTHTLAIGMMEPEIAGGRIAWTEISSIWNWSTSLGAIRTCKSFPRDLANGPIDIVAGYVIGRICIPSNGDTCWKVTSATLLSIPAS